MAKYIRNNAGVQQETPGLVQSTGLPDANKLVETDSSGRLDISLMPEGIGANSIVVVASEALAAGDFINIWNNNGTQNARKAKATGIDYQAHGFVNSAVTSGSSATVFTTGINVAVSGKTPGSRQYLSETPGRTAALPPSGTDKISQQLGVATSVSRINVTVQEPIVLA